MSTKLFPVSSFIVNQGNITLGQFVGLNVGPNLVLSSQGLFLGIDAAPGSGGGAVVFDDAVPANLSTIRSARLQQSPVDNTKPGITNLSSDTSGVSPGAVADFATIGGGDRNDIDVNSLYGTIGGGSQNSVKGQWGTVCGGFLNQAGSEFDAFGTEAVVCGGTGNKARGWDSAIVGGTANSIDPTAIQGLICGGQNGTVTGQNDTIINGYFCTASGGFSTVINGPGCVASGAYSTVVGQQAFASRPHQHSQGRYAAVGGTGSGAQSCRMPVTFDSGQLANSDFTLDDGVAYLVRVSCTMKQIGGANRAGFERTMLVHGAGGVAVIDQDIAGPNNVALNMGTGYTLVMSAVGNAIVATLNAGADNINAGLLYEWVEANDVL
jgi:hypothetical protein